MGGSHPCGGKGWVHPHEGGGGGAGGVLPGESHPHGFSHPGVQEAIRVPSCGICRPSAREGICEERVGDLLQ